MNRQIHPKPSCEQWWPMYRPTEMCVRTLPTMKEDQISSFEMPIKPTDNSCPKNANTRAQNCNLNGCDTPPPLHQRPKESVRNATHPMDAKESEPTHLLLLHLTTTGKQGEDLGSDEAPIVFLTYALHEIASNKTSETVNTLVYAVPNPGLVEPTEQANRCPLSAECEEQTGLADADVAVHDRPLLSEALEQLDHFLRCKNLLPNSGPPKVCIVTDGQLPIRLVLLPEATQKNIDLSNYPYFFKFHDLQKKCNSFYNVQSITSVVTALDYLAITSSEANVYGVRRCEEMSKVASRLITDGQSRWTKHEIVMKHYVPAIVKKTDIVDVKTVVKARGLPWQATDSDITKFFRGLNIEDGGIALVLCENGRRNGEAMIRFTDAEQQALALRKNRHHINQRYIEVYKGNEGEFIKVAGGESKDAEDFLSKLKSHNQTLIRMRGLPYSATAEDIIQFFNPEECPVQFDNDGILFVNQNDGKATGDAFVIFEEEDVAAKALLHHRKHIGSRYIELFKSTPAEVNQVMNSMKNVNMVDPTKNLLYGAATLMSPNISINPCVMIPNTSRVFIRIRGMPLGSTVSDILKFLEIHAGHIVFHGVHMVFNSQGLPAGEAIIHMVTEEAAKMAAEQKCHRPFTSYDNNVRTHVDVMQTSAKEVGQLTSHPMAQIMSGSYLPPPLLATSSPLGLSPKSPTTAGNHHNAAPAPPAGPVILPPAGNHYHHQATPLIFSPRDVKDFAPPGGAVIPYPYNMVPILGNGIANPTGGIYMQGGGGGGLGEEQYRGAPMAGNLVYGYHPAACGGNWVGFPAGGGGAFAEPPHLVYPFLPGGGNAVHRQLVPHLHAAAAASGAQVSGGEQGSPLTAGAQASGGEHALPLPADCGGPPTTSVIARGFPKDSQVNDVRAYLHEVMHNPEVCSAIHLCVGTDNVQTVEAVISFHNARDAMRMVTDHNNAMFRNHVIELSEFMLSNTALHH